MSSTHRKAILIVDDHAVIREGLSMVINQQEDLMVAAAVASASEALRSIRQSVPAAVLIDIALDRENGIELIESIRARWPGLPILALSMHDTRRFGSRAMRSGADRYIMKREPVTVLLGAIRDVIRQRRADVRDPSLGDAGDGVQFVSPVSIEPKRDPSALLSAREMEIFLELGRGTPIRKISSQTGLSPSTIQSYRNAIKRKLNLRTASEVVSVAARYRKEPDAH